MAALPCGPGFNVAFPMFGGNEKDDRNAIALSNGRGTKARTQKNGFGDRYVTITSYP